MFFFKSYRFVHKLKGLPCDTIKGKSQTGLIMSNGLAAYRSGKDADAGQPNTSVGIVEKLHTYHTISYQKFKFS